MGWEFGGTIFNPLQFPSYGIAFLESSRGLLPLPEGIYSIKIQGLEHVEARRAQTTDKETNSLDLSHLRPFSTTTFHEEEDTIDLCFSLLFGV